uniref:Uncharacterized protein n=1 Tax=Brassica oleracea TaxID=3712 RepID=A0A3P6D0Y7_BRAOL|nr:unnamed protein product [Brassica oleracea]
MLHCCVDIFGLVSWIFSWFVYVSRVGVTFYCSMQSFYCFMQLYLCGIQVLLCSAMAA